MKKFLSLVLALTLALCAGAALAAQDGPISIGVIQMVQHDALDAAYNGIVTALSDNGFKDGDNIVIDYQNGQGDQSNLNTIADRFVSNNVDLIFAIATPAALAVAGKTAEIPILGTAITDYVEARLVESNEVPGTNVSGTTDMANIADQIALVKRFAPEAKTVGCLYNSGEVNSVLQAEQAKAAIEAQGMSYVEKTVTSSNEVQQAAQSLVGLCDAIYIPTDNTIASSMALVYGVTAESKTPTICGESGFVYNGGLVTLGIDYYNLGYQTGLMAVKLLTGEETDVSKMPVESQTEFAYTVNKTVADEIGVAIPEDLLPFAIEMK